MSADIRTVTVYWTFHRGENRTIALSEEGAWRSLDFIAQYKENPEERSVEATTEVVPYVRGELWDVEQGQNSVHYAGAVGAPAGEKKRITSLHVLWQCPHCGRRHSTDLYHDSLNQQHPYPNPSIWFCELGRGIALVEW